MSQSVGLLSFPDIKEHGKSPFSKMLKNLIDLEARKLIANAYYRTEKLLRDNEIKLKRVSNYSCFSHMYHNGVWLLQSQIVDRINFCLNCQMTISTSYRNPL